MIKNFDAVLDKLVDMVIQFDKDCNAYQMDVYAHYDKETQTVSLDTFADDHCATICISYYDVSRCPLSYSEYVEWAIAVLDDLERMVLS